MLHLIAIFTVSDYLIMKKDCRQNFLLVKVLLSLSGDMAGHMRRMLSTAGPIILTASRPTVWS